MTDNDIIRMAREAGLPMAWIGDRGVLKWIDLEAFANLVAAHKAEIALAEAYRCGHEAGAVAEREEIAKLVDASVNADQYPTLTMLAQAIRMRGD